MLRTVTSTDELWLPLVDEPIGSIVDQIVAGDPELSALVSRPHPSAMLDEVDSALRRICEVRPKRSASGKSAVAR